MSKVNEQLALKARQWVATVVPKHADALKDTSLSFHATFKSGVILCEYRIPRITSFKLNVVLYYNLKRAFQ